MEQISNIATNQPQQSGSQTVRIAEAVSRDKARALGDVFDRWRLNQGWNPWDNDTQMAAIASWVHTLDREGVPLEAYGELYERVLSRRAEAVLHGRNVPSFGVELLIAEWTGGYGLRAEWRQREIDAGRTLTENAESVCQHCLGSGFRDNPNAPGFKMRCDHSEAA